MLVYNLMDVTFSLYSKFQAHARKTVRGVNIQVMKMYKTVKHAAKYLHKTNSEYKTENITHKKAMNLSQRTSFPFFFLFISFAAYLFALKHSE